MTNKQDKKNICACKREGKTDYFKPIPEKRIPNTDNDMRS